MGKLKDANAETIVYRDRAEIMVEELKAAELKQRNAEARVDVLEDELVASRSQLQALEADDLRSMFQNSENKATHARVELKKVQAKLLESDDNAFQQNKNIERLLQELKKAQNE